MSSSDILGPLFANHMRDKSYSTARALWLALRAGGFGVDAIELLLQWRNEAKSPFDRVQIGIDMNFLGLYAEAGIAIAEGLDGNLSDDDLYLAKHELAFALYGIGKFREAHSIYRSLRCASSFKPLIKSLYPSEYQRNTELFQKKFLNLDDSIAGKRVAVLYEGGIGDFMMYSRYLESMRLEGVEHVTIQRPDIVAGVLKPRSWLGEISGANIGDILDNHDFVTWSFTLFARYQDTPFYPSEPSSPWAQAADTESLPTLIREQLSDDPLDRKCLKIGILWRSTNTNRCEPYRSLTLATLAPLLSQQGCQFYSIHVGGVTIEERDLLDKHGVRDLGSHIENFSQTASVLDHLDLLIAPDTGPIHLAGAMGRPVWTLLSATADTRWYNDQYFTPWYASMRLYRQNALGDWSLPLSNVARDLQDLISLRGVAA